jgi:hypothetical protein
MIRLTTRLACCATLLALLAFAPRSADGPDKDRVALSTAKGKIKPPHHVPVQDGVDLTLYIETSNLNLGDSVDPKTVTADFTGYTLDCKSASTFTTTDATPLVLLKATFSVKAVLVAGNKASLTKVKLQVPNRGGSGDLTVTLNSTADGTSSVKVKAVGL